MKMRKYRLTLEHLEEDDTVIDGKVLTAMYSVDLCKQAQEEYGFNLAEHLLKQALEELERKNENS